VRQRSGWCGEKQVITIQSMSAPHSQPKAKAASKSVKLNIAALSLFFFARPN
jgi:hypothetical protein